jgi:tape measure domain-containing protein
MANDLELALRIRADVSAARKGIAGLQSDVKQLGAAGKESANGLEQTSRQLSRMQSSSAGLSSTLLQLKGALVALGVVRLVKDAANAGLALERMQRALLAATGSASGAAAELAFVRSEAERLGLDLESAGAQFASLAAAAKGTALEGAGARDIFSAVSEAATVMGLSAEQTTGALLAIQQMISKGTVSAEELRGQLGERLPGAFQLAARAMGVTTAELGKMLEQGQITAEQMLPALAGELRKTFGPALPEAVKSAQAQINRFQTAVFEAKAAFANSGFMDGLTGGLKDFTTALNDPQVRAGLADLGRALGDLIRLTGEAIAKFRELAPLIGAISGAVAGGRTGTLLGSVLGPQVAAGAGIVGAVIGGFKGYDVGASIQGQPGAAQPPVQTLPPVVVTGTPPKPTATKPKAGKSDAEREAEARIKSIEGIIKALQEEAATYGMTSEQIQIYKLQQLGANQATIEQATALTDTIIKQRDEEAALEATRKAIEEEAKARREAKQADDEYLLSLGDEIRLLGLSARERAQDEAVRRLSTEATAEQIEAVRTLSGALYDQQQAAQETTDQMSEFAVQAARNMQTAFADFLFDPFQGGLHGMLEGFINVLRQMTSEALAARIFETIGAEDLFKNVLSFGTNSGADAAAQQAAATAAAAALTTGGATAGTAITTGAVTGATALTASGTATAASIVAGAQTAAAILAAASAGGSGGAGGILSGLFHSGGIVGSGGAARMMPAIAFSNAPRYHSGGIAGLAADELPAVLRRNEEVLTRNDPRHRYNGGGQQAVTLKNINLFDTQVIGDYLATGEGEKVVLNIVSRNRNMLR